MGVGGVWRDWSSALLYLSNTVRIWERRRNGAVDHVLFWNIQHMPRPCYFEIRNSSIANRWHLEWCEMKKLIT